MSTPNHDPSTVVEADLTPPDLFCALACLRYDEHDAPPRWDAAAALISTSPGLVDQHSWAAAAASDVEALRRHLAEDPELATRRGGPYDWSPLLYLCYSRVPLGRSQADVLESAELLLDHGADPNSAFLWRGLVPAFTALTGVFGEGEQGARRQPRHPCCEALATLLLKRGADPADEQAIYNRMFLPANDHLELLFEYGLESLKDKEVWARQVDWAAANGFTHRLALLAQHGIDISSARIVEQPTDPNARDSDGQTPLHHAAWAGDLDRIRALLAAGADPCIKDYRFQATALAHAEYAYQTEAADLLRPITEH